ncbi:peptidase [Marinibactrum halimedae]|uniref:Peptidase n=2 Tax=Marinibactrum halimedae TaxID=1444977 RepID=A0AA37TAL9_9GAMM|nr:peptidase [Marinibactrum halimedae]
MFNGNKGSESSSTQRDDQDRQWQLIEQLALEGAREQRKARRWGVVFKSLAFAYVFVALGLFWVSLGSKRVSTNEEHVALIRVDGVISADEPANANSIAGSLRKAFEEENAKAVIMAINSPGGSPVQAGYINDEIHRLKQKYPSKKVYSVISDIGASGGYYIAVAADEIYADKASLVGSIGVTASGFGFVDSLDKLGVERRHYTAGEHKAFLDPFSPVKASETEFWQGVLNTVHKQFVTVVQEGRGQKLMAPEEELYSGLIWSGEQAKALGLIDGLGSAGYVAREVIGVEDVIDYSRRSSPLAQLVEQLGLSVGRGISSALPGAMMQSSLERIKLQ